MALSLSLCFSFCLNPHIKLESLLEKMRAAQSGGYNQKQTFTESSKRKQVIIPDLNSTADTTLNPGNSSVVQKGKDDQTLSLDINDILNSSGQKFHSGKEEDPFLLGEGWAKSSKVSSKKQRPSDDVHSLLTSTPTKGNKLPPITSSPAKGLTDLASLPPLNMGRSPPLLSTSHQKEMLLNQETNGTGNENHYDDDFEDDLDNFPKLTKEKPNYDSLDDYSLSKECLSELSEDIESETETMEKEEDKKEIPLLITSKELENVTLVTSDEEGEGEDFNRMAETDYKKRMLEMETEFEKKKVKPGDPNFVYDKEINFDGPKIESGWDSDLTMSDM